MIAPIELTVSDIVKLRYCKARGGVLVEVGSPS
jgi:hypothetical protein